MSNVLSTVASINEWKRNIERSLAPVGVTLPQALIVLSIDENGTQTVGFFADQMDTTRGNLTDILARMEEADLIETKRGKPDKRKVFINLSKKGAALVPEIKAIFSNAPALVA